MNYLFILISILLLSDIKPLSAEEVHFSPLRIFLTGGAHSLGRGGVDLHLESIEATPIQHPSRIADQKSNEVRLLYDYEDILHLTSGDLKGTSGLDSGFQLTTIVPLADKTGMKSGIAFSADQGRTRGYYHSEEDSITGHLNQVSNNKTLSIGLNPFAFFYIGQGVEIDTNGKTSYNWEIRASPKDDFYINIREFPRTLDLNIDLSMDGNTAFLPIDYQENVRELEIYVKLANKLSLDGRIDLFHQDSKKMEVEFLIIEPLSVIFSHQSKNIPYEHHIIVNEREGGILKGIAEYSEQGIGFKYDYSKSIRLYFNRRSLFLSTEGEGQLYSSSVTDLWTSLVVGNRNFIFDGSIDSTQYHIGIEKETSRKTMLRGGLQYIDVRLSGHLKFWRPIIFGLGQMNIERHELPWSQASLGVISLGFSYNLTKKLELTYGIAQYGLISYKKKSETSGQPGSATSEDSTSEENNNVKIDLQNIGNLFDRLIDDYPGVNVQLFELKWLF